MKPHDPKTSVNADVAARYDDDPRGDEAAAVAFLQELAGRGPDLEFAIGTGRIALPLRASGVRVDGIELSDAMVECFRNAARHLENGGVFVIEAAVPDAWLPNRAVRGARKGEWRFSNSGCVSV